MDTQAHAKACKAAGYGSLADALLRLRRTGEGSLQTVLKGLCREYTAAFFPRSSSSPPLAFTFASV